LCVHSATLADDETLLVQSGKPVAVFRTHEAAPRVLIANSNLVGDWATWDKFRELERAGLMMYGQMTAGSWIYIGSQGIVQGTYETFGAVARQHFGGSLRGRWVLTGGHGRHGRRAAAGGDDGGCVDPVRRGGSAPYRAAHRDALLRPDDVRLDEALALGRDAASAGEPVSVGLVGNCAEVLPELVRRGVMPDVVTDQTSAHDELNGYIPAGLSVEQAAPLREAEPGEYVERSMAVHARALRGDGRADATWRGHVRLRQQPAGPGAGRRLRRRVRVPRLRAGLRAAAVLRGQGAVPLGALSGDPEDIHRTDELVLELFPEDEHLRRWIELARERIAFQGLPARICWLGQGDRAKFGVALNDLVASGELKPRPLSLAATTSTRAASHRHTARRRP
jgi:urocanate hydratase